MELASAGAAAPGPRKVTTEEAKLESAAGSLAAMPFEWLKPSEGKGDERDELTTEPVLSLSSPVLPGTQPPRLVLSSSWNPLFAAIPATTQFLLVFSGFHL